MLSRDQNGDPHLELLLLSSYFAGIVSPDQRVAAVLQRRLHPTRVVVTGVVVTAAAAAAATAMLQPAAVAVVDLQRTHGTGIEGVGGRPPLAADFAIGPSC